MPSIVAVEAQIRTDDRPLLFLDTCIILDVIREFRPQILERGITAIHSVIDSAGNIKGNVEWGDR